MVKGANKWVLGLRDQQHNLDESPEEENNCWTPLPPDQEDCQTKWAQPIWGQPNLRDELWGWQIWESF